MNWLRYTLAFTEWEYLSSGANLLIKSLKISDTTKTDVLELISFQSDRKIWQKYCLADLSSVLDPLRCWPCRSFLTRGFFVILVTPLFAVYNFRNKKLLRLILFLKVLQIVCRFQKKIKKFSKYVLILR